MVNGSDWTTRLRPIILSLHFFEFFSFVCYDRHCIVGRNFGSYVTHETKHFIYFYLGQVDLAP